MSGKSLAVFEDQAVRRILCDGQWYYAVADVVAALTGLLELDGDFAFVGRQRRPAG